MSVRRNCRTGREQMAHPCKHKTQNRFQILPNTIKLPLKNWLLPGHSLSLICFTKNWPARVHQKIETMILIREVSQSCIHFYKVYLLRSRIPNSLFVSLVLEAFQCGSHYFWGLSCKVRVSTLTIGDLDPWSFSKLHSLLQSLSFKIQDSKFTICQFDPSSFSMWQSLFVRFIL